VEEVMTYLVAAYMVFWAISFGLVFSMVIRQRKLEADLRAMREMVDGEASPKE
jgi:hypothetical protein